MGDAAAAAAFKEAEDAKMAELDEVIKGLSGKDNKKARTEKEKEKKAIKDSKQYIDAEKIAKGKEPTNGFFVIEKEAKAAPVAAAVAPVESQEEKKDDKEKKEKPKKSMESAGISKAERDELEKLKNDIIARKKELKEQGMSGGQMNKDEQVVTWVARMNELKEKECPGSTAAGGKKDDKDGKKEAKANKTEEKMALEAKIEEYRLQLIQEFKYTPKEIKADPDMADMLKQLAKMK